MKITLDKAHELLEAMGYEVVQQPHLYASHWHDLYRAKCQELHDERARLGSEIVALEAELAEQAEQEPVAWWDGKEDAFFEHELCGLKAPADFHIPLYAAPVRTKDLTDDEIHDVFKSLGFSLADPRTEDFSVARAVIAADREKNK